MSDTKNTTENKAETKTPDTAPYMKKNSTPESKSESKKSNFVIPLVLLLVSAIVIIATFYEDEYNRFMAQEGTQDIAATEVIAKVEETEISTIEAQIEAQPVASVETITEKAEIVTQSEATDQSVAVETATADKAEKVTAENTVVAPEKSQQTVNNYARTRPAYAPYQYNSYNREQAQTRTQAAAKQRMEILQQRRQAYEKEMQDRRAQYETAMKAQQEKRANVAKAQKAVFQRAQQNRIETNQKIQEIHKQIAKLHEEIHRLMLESKRNSAPVQMQSM
jgi:hypothetical protein